MNAEKVISHANNLFKTASFIAHIYDKQDYDDALALMDELVEDYDANKALIEVLAVSIARWEDTAEEFSEFNNTIDSLAGGVAMLRVLKDQYHLNNTDFQDEIGGKSMVSMILNGSRSLTLSHIKKLSQRFNVPVQYFI